MSYPRSFGRDKSLPDPRGHERKEVIGRVGRICHNRASCRDWGGCKLYPQRVRLSPNNLHATPGRVGLSVFGWNCHTTRWQRMSVHSVSPSRNLIPSYAKFCQLQEKVKPLLDLLDSRNHIDFPTQIIGDNGTQKPQVVDLNIITGSCLFLNLSQLLSSM